ncbi:alpha/beta hydrolase [Mycolicibacterium celeriflavum]|uniref:alpha/beta hydrolase n=1 Tax=Mycolicibacterium celeriflavum TaxID=1249101 RepID=UPI0007FC55F6|nr:alpha/beta hydrolase [Mycolicibacterium celeriflavum]OBG15613.1 alpha/beta hydrolase [Mycolicibacterium celeriflavum]
MTRPTIGQAEAWRPEALHLLAAGWDRHARLVSAHADTLAAEFSFWSGAAADAARIEAKTVVASADAIARALVLGAAAARDGAAQLASARADVMALVSAATADGFAVDDTGSVSVQAGPSELLVALSGGVPAVAAQMLAVRAAELTGRLGQALDRLDAADADAASDIAEAFVLPAAGDALAEGDVVAAWPTSSQDRIAEQIAAMTPEQRQRLVEAFPSQVGNTDGLPWEMRIEANRTNVAQAVLRERDPDRLALYQNLLAEIDDPAGEHGRIDRQLLAFDPGRASLVELHGDVASASSVAVLVPGLNTTIEGSAANARTARRFVSATHGDTAAITYLGGPFPRGDTLASALAAAADPRYALAMAPRLVAFSEDVDRTVDATGRRVPVTVIGHSYGGSIVGTAESLGLTSDRTLYVAAAGAGVGVDDPGDWHNRNPDVLRFSMTPPGDLIALVQGIPGGPHGADPDEMPGVIRLPTGRYDDGRPMAGPGAHSDVLNASSDSWRAILSVITGDLGRDGATSQQAG